MAEAPTPPDSETIDLKDPALAALLAWLIPGLGHWYQGRRAKAVLYFVSIMGLFSCGVYLSSSNQPCRNGGGKIGYGRAVYFAWQREDHHLAYLCQIGVGLPALPAIVQAFRMSNQQKVWWGGFMAPPWPSDQARRQPSTWCKSLAGTGNDDDPKFNLDQPTLDELNRLLAPRFRHRRVLHDGGRAVERAGDLRRLGGAGRRCNRPRKRRRKKMLPAATPASLDMDLWYALPAIIAISLVYAATRHERMRSDSDARQPRGPVAGRFHVRRLRRAGIRRLVHVALLADENVCRHHSGLNAGGFAAARSPTTCPAGDTTRVSANPVVHQSVMPGLAPFFDPEGPFSTSSRSKALQCGRNHSSSFFSRATARTTSVSNRCPARTSSARAWSTGVASPSWPTMSATRAGLLGHRFRERDLQVVAHDGQHHARHAPAGAHVEHLFLRSQELGERQAIDQVAGDELLVVGVPREIDLRVPIPEQFAVSLEQGDLRRRQFDFVPPQRGGQVVVGGCHGDQ